MFLWDKSKFASSANISSVKGFDALNRSFTQITKRRGSGRDPWEHHK